MNARPLPESGLYILPAIWLVAEPAVVNDLAAEQQEVARYVVEPSLELVAYRDGLLLFSWGHLPMPEGLTATAALLASRMQLINAYAGCLFSAIGHVDGMVLHKYSVDRQQMVHRTAGTDSLQCGNPVIWALATGPDRRFTAVNAIATVFPAQPGEDGAASPGAYRIHTITKAALDQSVDTLRVLLREGDGALARVALHLNAVHANETYSYNQALVDAWFVAEAVLGDWWRDYIATAGKGALSRTRKELLEGRDFTASARTEVLQLAGKITPDMYDRLGKVRRLRNKAAHALQPVSHDDAAFAVQLASDLLTARYQAPLGLVSATTISL